MTENIELVVENVNISVKKKKGRPRKNPIELPTDVEVVPQEKKKRGRKKKEKVEEEVKQKKKRGRKAALKFFSSTIRKKIPLTTIIYDNDKSILHLDIKDDEDSLTKTITYDVLKSEYNKEDTIFGTKLSSLETGKRSFESDDEGQDQVDDDDENEDDDNDDDDDDDSETDIPKSFTNEKNDDDILCEYIENDEKVDITELYEKRLQHRLKQDDQLIKNLENLHNDDNLLSKLLNNVNQQVKATKTIVSQASEADIKKQGVYSVLSQFIETDNWIDKTDVSCWWCCHKFDSIPVGLPTDYNTKLKKFRVKGVFCSFACMLANSDMSVKTKSMVTYLYKQLTGGYTVDMKDDYIKMLYNDYRIEALFKDNLQYKDEYIKSLASFIDEPLTKAPPRCVLKMFGGELSIDEFRNATKERKVYKMIEYPMYVSRDYVEEVDLQNLKKVNKNLFGKQQYMPQTNTLDDKKLEEVKNRINSSVVVTNNSIDRFITF
jgi:hypothetical protein